MIWGDEFQPFVVLSEVQSVSAIKTDMDSTVNERVASFVVTMKNRKEVKYTFKSWLAEGSREDRRKREREAVEAARLEATVRRKEIIDALREALEIT